MLILLLPELAACYQSWSHVEILPACCQRCSFCIHEACMRCRFALPCTIYLHAMHTVAWSRCPSCSLTWPPWLSDPPTCLQLKYQCTVDKAVCIIQVAYCRCYLGFYNCGRCCVAKSPSLSQFVESTGLCVIRL